MADRFADAARKYAGRNKVGNIGSGEKIHREQSQDDGEVRPVIYGRSTAFPRADPTNKTKAKGK